MMKFMRIAVGALFVLLGFAMLILVLRQGGPDANQAAIGPLALMGGGALAISSARKRKP